MSLLSIVGGLIGTAIAPGAGTAIGAELGGVAGSSGGAGVQNPGGPAAFARWASEGHFDWVASVALNMSGPDWSRDPSDTGQPWKTGYSPADAQSAAAVLAQYHRSTNGQLLPGYTTASAPGAAPAVVASASTPTVLGSVLDTLGKTAVGLTQAQATAKSSVASTSIWAVAGVAAFVGLLVIIYNRKG